MMAVLVHNDQAGKKAPSPTDLLTAVRRCGYAVRYQPLKSLCHSSDILAGADLVLVAGGDGTVAETIRFLSGHSIPLAIIPTGTANNIAHGLGLAEDLNQALAALHAPFKRRLDIGLANWNGKRWPFLEAIGFGPLVAMLKARIDADGDEKLARGRKAIFDAVAGASPLELEIIVSGKRLHGSFLMVEVLNISFVGPRLRLSRQVDPGDGMLDVVCLPCARRDQMLAWLDEPSGCDSPLDHCRTSEVEIRGGGCFRLDDELRELGGTEALTISVDGFAEILAGNDPIQVKTGRYNVA